MRPSWQIDLKWMLGLAACALIVVSGVLYSLSHITLRDTAIPMAGALVSAGINDRVSDGEYAQVQAAAAANPGSTVSLSPIALSFSGSDIAGMDKKSAAKVVGSKLAGVMYDNGGDAAKALLVTPAPETGMKAVSLGPVGALTASNHDLFTKLFVALTAFALVALGGVALLSRGWGRLGAPSFIMAIGTAPLALAWVGGASAVGSGDPGEGDFTQAAREAFNAGAGDLRTFFVAIAVAALVTGVLCVIGSLISMMISKAEKSVKDTVADPAPAAPAAAPAKPAAPAVTTAPLKGSASIAATTYRASGTPQVAPKPEPAAQQQVA